MEYCVKGRRIFVVLDGLDECELKVRREVHKFLHDIQAQHVVSICLSIRENINLPPNPVDSGTITTFTISLPKETPDIGRFIDAELQDRINSGELNINEFRIFPAIKEALIKGSQGMFLWVALQIKSLCLMHTDHAIVEAIQNLPKDLPETYRRLLRSADNVHQQNLQKQIFEWTIVAKVPLTTMELREALSITPYDLDWDWSKLINNIHFILGYCGGLVRINEEEDTIRFVHQSVNQFVLSAAETSRSWAVNMKSASENSTIVLLTYLNLGVFGTQLCKVNKSRMDTENLVSHVMGSVARESGMARWIPSGLSKSHKRPNFDIGLALEKIKRTRNPSNMSFKFHTYASTFWCHHILDVEKPSSPLLDPLNLAITDARIDLDQVFGDGSTPWTRVAAEDRSELLEFFLIWSRIDIKRDTRLDAILVKAIISGSTVVLDVLNLRSAIVPDKEAKPLLHLAVLHGQAKSMSCLLEMYAGCKHVAIDIDHQYRDGKTLLMLAASLGHADVVRKLLEYQASPYIKAPHGLTAVTYAVAAWQTEQVRILSSEVETESEYVPNALYLVEAQEYMETISLLIKHLPLKSRWDLAGRDIFKQAIIGNVPELFDCLLSIYLEDVQHAALWSPLAYAVVSGQQYFVKLLLGTGKIDVNRLQLVHEYYSETALHVAARYGNLEILKSLLAVEDIDINIKSGVGETASALARRCQKVEVIQLLEDHERKKERTIVESQNQQGDENKVQNEIVDNPPLGQTASHQIVESTHLLSLA